MNRVIFYVLVSYAPLCLQAGVQQAQLIDGYGKLPLSFEANIGQADRRVRFVSRGSGYGLYLTGDEAVFALRKGGCGAAVRPGARRGEPGCEHDVVRMRLAGASGAAAAGEEPLPGKANYFIGSDPAQWRTGVPTYAKVRYRSVYPGVDLVYYGNQRQLEYDFLVAPGGDPKQIRLGLDGAKGLRLDADGDLVVTASHGALAFHKPVVYQLVDGQRKAVVGNFAMLDKRTVGFRVGDYDRAKPLVIDPVLTYSTYLGGSVWSSASAIAVDADGNAYVAGSTASTDFPVTQGALQATVPTCSNCVAAFVAKLNPSGTALVYSTYLGASGSGTYARAYALAVDDAGSAYVAGSAGAGFPVTAGAFQAACSDNAFAAKLNPAGSALVYSTCLGAGDSYLGVDQASALAVDSAGNAYVAGVTYSSEFPVTPGAFQTNNKAGEGSNAFVTKLNPAGSALIYSTYLGGSGRILFSFGPQQWDGDGATGLAVDGAGNAYVTGYAFSVDFPVTAGAFQTTNPAVVPYGVGGFAPSYNQSNAFVTKLNPTGTALVYSTYLGGSGAHRNGDSANGLAVDESGHAYVAGVAYSTDFPVSHGAFQTTSHSVNSGNAFVAKLNPAGSALVYSTYLGGSGASWYGDSANGLVVDETGNAYLAGGTWSNDFPVTSGAFQPTNRSPAGGNAFFAEVNPAGSALIYSTYLGGSGANVYGDSASGLALDGYGNVLIAGDAWSADFPVTAGAIQTASHSSSGNPSAFVAKLGLNATPPAPAITPGGTVPVDSTAGAIQAGEWASIYGTNLASVVMSQTGGFPQSLGGTSVTIDGKPAYLSYVSPGQINLQVPDDTANGTVSVVVTTGGGSASAGVTLADVAPSFFLFDGKHVAGVILRQDGTGAFGQGVNSYDLLGPTGTSLGFPTVAAKAGDIVELFGTGFGPTNPAVPSGQAFSGAAVATYTVSLQINNTGVAPMWAGLSAAGLGQINLTIPSGLGTGDVPLVAGISGGHTPLYVTPSYVVISLE